MTKIRSMLALCAVLTFAVSSGCARNPAEDVSQAQVGEAVETPTEEPQGEPAAGAAGEGSAAAATSAPAAPAAPTNEVLAVTPSNSRIEFEGSKVTGSHIGNFPDFSGSVTLNAEDVSASRVSITIDTTTLVADNERLTGHLRSEDFFNVAAFPTSTFVSTSIAEGGADGATHTITGNLTLVGQTRSITFPATIRVAADSVSAEAEFFILRQDFGIVYPGMPDDLIRNEVVIRLDLDLPRG